jgi:ABC-type branched-subunit amino acid transport system ATPase component
MSALLQLRDVTKRFGGVVANDAISLEVREGAIVGLIGPNGSGKTTLFNAITGAFPIDRGSVRFRSQEISKLLTKHIAREGLIRTYQQPRIYGRMTVEANMLASPSMREASFVGLFGKDTAAQRAQAAELLDFVGLAAKRGEDAGDLSFGQQKLLELAMALMNEPKMLLLDEPTAGINPVLIESLLDRLRAANAERGLTLLIIEHNMPVIMGLAEHIYCLAHGRLLASGSPEAVRADPKVIDAYLGSA